MLKAKASLRVDLRICYKIHAKKQRWYGQPKLCALFQLKIKWLVGENQWRNRGVGRRSIQGRLGWMYEIRPKNSGKKFNCLILRELFVLLEKGPTCVHISDRRGLFFQVIAADFAIKGAAANIKTPGRFVFVPIRLFEYSGN